MRDYELVLIFDPEESEQKEVLEKLKEFIDKQGNFKGEKGLGRRQLAYPLKSRSLKKLQEGEFFQIDFEAEPKVVEEIGKKLKLEEKILRFLIVRKEGGEKKDAKKPK